MLHELSTRANIAPQVLNQNKRIYCRILNFRLREFLEGSDALSDEQNGFRPNRCCQDHIFTLTSTIEKRMLNRKDSFAFFYTFYEGILNSVNRELLWQKLEKRFSMNGNFLLAIKALYKKKVSCAIDVNDSLTDWFDV